MSGTLERQRRVLVALGAACVVLTVIALVASVDALVLHSVPAFLDLLAFVAGTIALCSLGRAAARLVTVGRASRRAARTLPLRPGPIVDGHVVTLVADAVPGAFCLGLLRPRVVVSTGALARLDGPGLSAVVAHERHHARRRDGLRRVLADAVLCALLPLPALPAARSRYDTLLELHADQTASGGPAGVHGLAQALLAFDGPGRGAEPDRVRQLVAPGSSLPPLAGLRTQGLALVLTLVALIGAITASTRCVDIYVLRERDATASRWPVLLLVVAAALLVELGPRLPGFRRVAAWLRGLRADVRGRLSGTIDYPARRG